MPMVLPDPNPAFAGLPDLLGKQSLQLQRFAFRRPVERSGLGTSECVTASRSSSSNSSPIQIPQVCDIQTSHRGIVNLFVKTKDTDGL